MDEVAAGCPVENGMVTCVNGYVEVDGQVTDTTCDVACGEKCCVGEYTNEDGEIYNACDGFSGKICLDGTSCIGSNACRFANIESVVYSCHGYEACYWVAGEGSLPVKKVHNSCLGNETCSGAADYGGSISKIVDSCVGSYACFYAANGYTYDDDADDMGGSIDEIVGSCQGYASVSTTC